jgi:hypothetical protein
MNVTYPASGGPTVLARLAFRRNTLLISFRQSNVAVTTAMDMHEHRPSDKKASSWIPAFCRSATPDKLRILCRNS